MIQAAPALEASVAQVRRRPHRRRGILRVRNQERPEFGSQKSGRVKRLDRRALAADLHVLADRDEGRHRRILRPQCLGHDRADVRDRQRLRRNVSRVPVKLMPRMQDEAEIRGLERANQRSAVHHLRDALEPLRDLDVVHHRVDRRKRAEDSLGPHSRLEGRISLRVECLGLRHSAGHPQDDDGIRRGFRTGCAHHLRFAAHQRRKGCCRGHSHTHKSTAAELGND